MRIKIALPLQIVWILNENELLTDYKRRPDNG